MVTICPHQQNDLGDGLLAKKPEVRKGSCWLTSIWGVFLSVDFYPRSILLVDFYPRSIFVGWHLFREYFVGWLLYEEFFCRLTFIFQACTEEKETFKEMFALLRWVVSIIIIIIMAANITNLTLLSKSSRRYNLKFRDWAFMMFAISNFLTSLGYPIPYTFVPV